MSMTTLGKTLLKDYNHWRAQTAHIQKLRREQPIRDLGERKYLQTFVDLGTWCEEQGVSPRLWLFSLFQTRSWMKFCASTRRLLKV